MASPSQSAEKIPSPLAATAFKLVGAIAVVSSLVDILMLLIPPNFGDLEWRIERTSAIVNTGIVPLVGVALLLAGYWIDSSLGKRPRRSSLAVDPRFWTCLLSCVFGVIFLFTTLLHPNNLRINYKQTMEQVETQATTTADQFEGEIGAEVARQRAQFDAILQDESVLDAEIESGNLDEAAIAQIETLKQNVERFRNNPEALDSYIESQVGEARNQLQSTIATQKEELTSQLNTRTIKSMIKVTFSSLLLAIGFNVLGWLGLRRLLAMVN